MKRTFTLCAALFIGAVAMAQSTVTFKVDITNYLAGGATLDPTGIRVAGTFSTNGGTVTAGAMADWSPTVATSALTDLGNNIWSIDVTFPSTAVDETLQYKFVNGNWGANEGTDPTNTIASGGCGTTDGATPPNINRTLVIPAAATTLTYCWDQCTALCATGLDENAISNVVVSPNPTSDVATVKFDLNNASDAIFTLFDLTGKVVMTKTVTAGVSNAIEVASINAGTYFYNVKAGDNVATGKLIKR
jgi:hypothetical protein